MAPAAPAAPPVFVVGTGRSGSTFLSRCLRMHPDVASLSEFFVFVTDLAGRIAGAFPDGDAVDAATFWRIVGTAHPRQHLMLRHDVMMDEALYRPAPGRRFTRDTGIPAIAATTLPHLAGDDDTDARLDAVETFVRSLAPAPIGEQYRRLFDHLRAGVGARVVVERSGGSLRIVRRLRRHFPGARFVHLVRDGRDAALSMSRHLGFRMALIASQLTEILGVDPFESTDRRWIDDVPDDLVAFLPEHFDRAAFLAYPTPPPLCGHYWSGEIQAGLADLQDLGPDHLLTLRYEDLLAEPAETLSRFLGFVVGESAPAALIDRMVSEVRRPRSGFAELEGSMRDEVARACAPGMEALRRAGR